MHHVKYFTNTFNPHNHPSRQIFFFFTIESTGLERLDDLPKVSRLVPVRPDLTSQLVRLIIQPSCLGYVSASALLDFQLSESIWGGRAQASAI